MTDHNSTYAERGELVGAGWEPKDAEGTVVRRNPANGYFYPHGLAVRLMREQAGDDGPEKAGRRDDVSTLEFRRRRAKMGANKCMATDDTRQGKWHRTGAIPRAFLTEEGSRDRTAHQ